MINIGVCDNDLAFIETIATYLSSISAKVDTDFKTNYFNSSSDLLYSYEKDTDYHILLLDIELDDINGVELADFIRNNFSKDVFIVFISSYPDYVFHSFNVKPYNFLVKPLIPEKLEQLLVNIFQEILDRQTHYYPIIDKKTNELVINNYNDIVFLEVVSSPKRLLKFRTIDETIYSTGRLNKYYDSLVKFDFVKICRSFVVNIHHIKRISSNNVLVSTNERLPLSESYRLTLESKYNDMVVKRAFNEKRQI